MKKKYRISCIVNLVNKEALWFSGGLQKISLPIWWTWQGGGHVTEWVWPT